MLYCNKVGKARVHLSDKSIIKSVNGKNGQIGIGFMKCVYSLIIQGETKETKDRMCSIRGRKERNDPASLSTKFSLDFPQGPDEKWF